MNQIMQKIYCVKHLNAYGIKSTFLVQCRILTRDECLSYVPSKFGQNHASKTVNVFVHDPAYLHCKVPLQSVNNLVSLEYISVNTF